MSSAPEGTLPHVDLWKPGMRTISAADMNAVIRAARIIEKISGSGGVSSSGGLTGLSFVDTRPPDNWRWGRTTNTAPPTRTDPGQLADNRYWLRELRATSATRTLPTIEMVDDPSPVAFYDMAVNMAEAVSRSHNIEPGTIVRFSTMVVDCPGVPINVAWFYCQPANTIRWVRPLSDPAPLLISPNRWKYRGAVQAMGNDEKFADATPSEIIDFYNSIENYNNGTGVEGNGVDRNTALYQRINFAYRPLRGDPVVPVIAVTSPAGKPVYETFVPNADDGEC